MKTTIFFLSCFVGIYCGKKQNSGEKEISSTVLSDSLPKKILIKDESMYSKKFLNSLRIFLNQDSQVVSVELRDSLIYFIPRKTPTKFPTYPRIDRHYSLVAVKDSVSYELNLHRINYSEVEFHFFIKNALTMLYESSGVATIGIGFAYGAESYDDEISMGAYDAYEYSFEANGCFVSFALGNPGGKKEIKGKIKEITCGNSKVHELIENMPTLRAKLTSK